MAGIIEQDPEGFARDVLAALSSGSPRMWERLRLYGIRLGVSAHHSEVRYCGTHSDHNSPDTRVTFP